MSDFWDWALVAYARPGVAETCLDLQDTHGQNVPLLLWAAWAALHGRPVRNLADRAVAVTRAWQPVIEPLRSVRRTLKTPLGEDDPAVRLPLRDQVKTAELAAERALMLQLATVSGSGGQAVPDAPMPPVLLDTLRDALLAVSYAWDAPMCPADGLAQLSARLYAKV